MRFEVLRENLKKGLELPLRAISSKPQLPVLANVLLEAKREGLFVGGTDLEMGVRVKVGAKVEEEGSVTVPARMFFEFVSKLPGGKMLVYLEDKVLKVESGGYKASFQTIASEEFPKIVDVESVEFMWKVRSEVLREGVRKVLYAVARDSMRPILTGVLWERRGKKLRLVGTDGFRLAIKEVEARFVGDEWEELAVPARIVSELVRFEEGEVRVGVLKENRQVVFEHEGVTLVGQVLDGGFPDYKRIIPQEFGVKVKMDKNSMEEAVGVAMVFARDNSNILKWRIEGGKLVMEAESPEQGKNVTELDVETEGEGEIAFNGKFVLDFLQNAEGKEVFFGMNDSLSPGVFREESRDDWLYLVMPVNM